jgi:TFIIS helical bundle-like domain
VQIEDAVSKTNYHPVMLKAGFVNSLKAFLEPLQTDQEKLGQPKLTIPHVAVRRAVYSALQKLNIRTEQQEGRDYLRTSNLGPVLRFYSRIPHETELNKRVITELLNKWMLPIVEEGRRAFEDVAGDRRKREVRCALFAN